MNAAILAELKKRSNSDVGTPSSDDQVGALPSGRRTDHAANPTRHMSTPSNATFAKAQARQAAGGAGKSVVKRGWLHKRGGASGALFSRESWKRRWVVLEERRLIWYEDEASLPKGEVRSRVT